MNWPEPSTRLHWDASVPIVVAEPSVYSSPRCAPASGTSQPIICMPPELTPAGPPAPPPELSPPPTMNACVFIGALALACIAAAAAACCAAAACAQYGHWNQL